jgi:hypothetical protein
MFCYLKALLEIYEESSSLIKDISEAYDVHGVCGEFNTGEKWKLCSMKLDVSFVAIENLICLI